MTYVALDHPFPQPVGGRESYMDIRGKRSSEPCQLSQGITGLGITATCSFESVERKNPVRLRISSDYGNQK
jgi:hypothetical protein